MAPPPPSRVEKLFRKYAQAEKELVRYEAENLKDAEAQKQASIAVYRKTVQEAFKDIRTSLTAQREADAIVKKDMMAKMDTKS